MPSLRPPPPFVPPFRALRSEQLAAHPALSVQPEMRPPRRCQGRGLSPGGSRRKAARKAGHGRHGLGSGFKNLLKNRDKNLIK